MHQGDEPEPESVRSGDQAREFNRALDDLRSTLSEEATPENWRMNIAWIGVLAALFGTLAWYATLSERSAEALRLDVEAELPLELGWVRGGFSQVFTAYAHAGNRLRVKRSDGVSDPVLGRALFVLDEPEETNRTVQVRLATGPSGEQLTATLTLLDGAERSREAVLQGRVAGLSDLASRTALKLFEWMEVDPFTQKERRLAAAQVPEDQRITRPYVLGLQALREGRGRDAVARFNEALAHDAAHPMLNAALAEALEFLGYRKQAAAQIQLAYDHRDALSREKQLSIEARLRLLQNDWAASESLYAALVAFHPDEVGYHLALAETRYRGNRISAAVETLERLREQEAFSEDPRIDLTEAQMWRRVGDWQKGVAAAERAVDLAQAGKQDGLLARALVLRADMGGDERGIGLDLSEVLFREMNDPHGISQVLREQGDRHVATGALAAAAEAYDEAIRVSVEVGNEAEVASAQQARAIVHDLVGELNAGQRLKRAVLASYRRRDVGAGAAVMMENIGISLYKLGRLEDARQMFGEALAAFETHNDLIGIAWWPYQEGRVLARLGQLKEARQMFEQALVNAQIQPEGHLALHTSFELARLDLFEGAAGTDERLKDIADTYDAEALQLDQADTEVLRARFALAHGRTDAGWAMANRALDVFQQSDARYYLTAARTQLVRSGDTSACAALQEQAQDMEYRELALLALAALSRCPGVQLNTEELLSEAKALSLFEPELALTALADPAAARELGEQRGWLLPEYWAAP